MFPIEAYVIPEIVEYLQVEFSFVETEIVLDVVPAGKDPLGAPLEITGGVVSEGGIVALELYIS